MSTRLTKKRAEALAEDIYTSATDMYAREVVALMKKHKLALKKDLQEWQKRKEAEE